MERWTEVERQWPEVERQWPEVVLSSVVDGVAPACAQAQADTDEH
jgi:hypothetical protein